MSKSLISFVKELNFEALLIYSHSTKPIFSSFLVAFFLLLIAALKPKEEKMNKRNELNNNIKK